MLTRRLAPPGFHGTRHVIRYEAQGTGASGAITLQQGKGITLAKSATGTYTATVQGHTGGGAILYANAQVVADAAKQVTVKSFAITSNCVVTFEVAANTALGTPVDLADGDILCVQVSIRNSPSDSS